MWGWKHVKMNWYIPANIYICSLCLFILPPLFDKCSWCYGNGLFDVAKTSKILRHFWQRRSRVIRNSCKWPRKFKASGVLGPQITKFWWENCCIFQDLYRCLFVRGILPVSVPVPVNFLSLNFCIWSVWPVNHWLFMYWMIVKCCLTNTSIVCYLYLFKESFPYNSG